MSLTKALCGANEPYDPAKQFCTTYNLKDTIAWLCNSQLYDLDASFCVKGAERDSLVARCNGQTYNIDSTYCKNNAVTKKTFVSTRFLNQEMLANGDYGFLFDERDGKVYRTVQIGNQTWMAQNVDYQLYSSGTYNKSWKVNGSIDGVGRYYLKNDADSLKTVCPAGWSIPSKADMVEFFKAVGSSSNVGAYHDGSGNYIVDSTAGLAEALASSFDVNKNWVAADSNWKDKWKQGGGTDKFGFALIPSGYLYNSGSYYKRGEHAYFMVQGSDYSSTRTNLVKIVNQGDSLQLRRDTQSIKDYYPVRCIKK